jgi:hypothetical protein
MKKALILLLSTIALASCTSGDKKATESTTKDSLTADMKNAALADSANYTTIEWLDSTYLDLGKQMEGKAVELSFRFKNTGTKNLVIQDVSAQCGCTIPEKPEKPFAPGETGTIKAMFNGSGHGEIRKEVYVKANTSPNNAHTLTFRAELIK